MKLRAITAACLAGWLAACASAPAALTLQAEDDHQGEAHSTFEAPWQAASAWPDRLALTFADDPARTLAVSWRTDQSANAATAEIVKASPDARFDLGAVSVAATTERVDLSQLDYAGARYEVAVNRGLPPVHYHSVLFSGLEPDTLYAYRVSGGDGKWSEWYQARTAPLSGPITFLYVGDAQNGILTHWARTIRAAYKAAPDARFIIHAGDMVDKGSRDFEWAQWFKALGFIHGMMPAVPVAGNHEYPRVADNNDDAGRALSILWRPAFRLPETAGLPDALRETVYKVPYSADLDLFVLDSQGGYLEEQAAWLDAELTASKARWRIVTQHHPIFSSGRDRDNADKRDALLPVILKHNVDLVLQGHDHTYARGAIGQTPERYGARAGEEVRSFFINSVSGAKQYDFSEGGWSQYAPSGVRLDRRAENTQFFQRIHIDGASLTYEAYTADGQLYDRFAVTKDASGLKRLSADGTPSTAERRFEGTKPYPGTDGLNYE
jgi:3',5'-cyclic AMP phosphodiesterase CpdA